MVDDRKRGLYRKYDVRRLDDLAGKHKDCFFFVLDITHDKFAIPAIRAYAKACKQEYPALAADLYRVAIHFLKRNNF
jgi:hypothetical protein